MPERLQDQINNELNRKGIIDVDEKGFVRKGDKSSETPINPETGNPVTRLIPSRWGAWYHDNNKRFLIEKYAMKERFPDFELIESVNGLTWTGPLTPKNADTYVIAVIYPEDFPYSSPNVWIIEPKIQSPKHQFPDGHICLLELGNETWETKTTAATIVALAAVWLWCYEYHQKYCGCNNVPCNYWPGIEV